MAAKLKKGDEVIVISGRDKGKRGRIIAIDRKAERVVVEGVMRVKKHVKAGRSAQGATTGGIETVEAPIHISNVMYYDPEAAKAKKGDTTKKIPGTRVGIREEKVEKDGRMKTVRIRYSKATGKDL
ncbi:MAG: 50S ribosomal protein L24 [Actinomycetaceae bacterium]|nr:50S ribosomal protein L24 [Actinomycetaceae bacterium]